MSHGRFEGTLHQFGTMGQLDEDTLAKWVLKHSDMTLSDMTLAKAYGKQAVCQLFTVATQIPLTWQTFQVLRNVKMFSDFAEWRDEVCGKRFAEHQGAPQPVGGN